MAQLELKVVSICMRMEAYLLKQLLVRRLFRKLLFLLLLVFPLAEVNDLADWRLCIRDNLDQVLALAPREFYRLAWRHDANHLAIFANQTNFGNADLLVHPNSGVTRRKHAAETVHALLRIWAWPRANRWATHGSCSGSLRTRGTGTSIA